jgi:hypothetical protein
MSVRKGDYSNGNRDRSCIKHRLQEGSIVGVEESVFTSHGRGGENKG